MANASRKPRSLSAIFGKATWKATISLAEGHKVTVEAHIGDAPTLSDVADAIRSAKTDKEGRLSVKAPDTATEKENGISLPITRSLKDTTDAAIEALYASVGLCVPDEDTEANLEAMAKRNGTPVPTV